MAKVTECRQVVRGGVRVLDYVQVEDNLYPIVSNAIAVIEEHPLEAQRSILLFFGEKILQFKDGLITGRECMESIQGICSIPNVKGLIVKD